MKNALGVPPRAARPEKSRKLGRRHGLWAARVVGLIAATAGAATVALAVAPTAAPVATVRGADLRTPTAAPTAPPMAVVSRAGSGPAAADGKPGGWFPTPPSPR